MIVRRPALLFVCTGNICRSPLAEGTFRAAAERLGLVVTVDSAGTGRWHIGEPPDHRAIDVARRNGLDISRQRARVLVPEDYERFTDILALDRSHLSDIEARRPEGATARISLLLDHVPGRRGKSVADPYYGDMSDFDTTFADVSEAAEVLAAMIARDGWLAAE